MLAEAQHYLERIEDLRRQVRDMIAEMPAEALNWRPIEGSDDHATNSLAVIAAHVAGSEHFWIAEVIGGYPATRDRNAEFVTEVSSAAGLLQRLDTSGAETRLVLPSLTAAELDGSRQAGDKIVPVRWAILHVIDHTSLHLGHMQLTYQLWHGGQGANAPRWYQRLPPA